MCPRKDFKGISDSKVNTWLVILLLFIKPPNIHLQDYMSLTLREMYYRTNFWNIALLCLYILIERYGLLSIFKLHSYQT